MSDTSQTNPRINNRLIDLYTLLIQHTLINHNQTMETIQQLEQGIRQLTRNITDNREPIIHEYDERNNNQYSRNTNTNINRDNIAESLRELFGVNMSGQFTEIPATRNNSPRRRQYNNNTATTNNLFNNINRNRQPSTMPLFTSTLFNNMNLDNLTPVIVRPTRQQIENATEIINFTQELEGTICPITQAPFEENSEITRIIYCGHCFVDTALNNWFNRSVLCPVCRYDIRNHIRPISTTPRTNTNRNTTPRTNTNRNTTPRTNTNRNTTSRTNTNRNTTPRTNTNRNTNGEYTNDNDDVNVTSEPIQTSSTNNDMQTILDSFTNQISQAFTQQLLYGDISFNNMENRGVNVEYIVETPNNSFSISSMSSTPLGDIMRNIPQPDTTQYNNDNDSDSDSEVDVDVELTNNF
ncbi:replication termination factor 2 family protein [Flavobacteriaceae bacterium]|nr:replication termination factor 2 family protein [Flavobacteriaceae bacterium]